MESYPEDHKGSPMNVATFGTSEEGLWFFLNCETRSNDWKTFFSPKIQDIFSRKLHFPAQALFFLPYGVFFFIIVPLEIFNHKIHNKTEAYDSFCVRSDNFNLNFFFIS